MTTGEDDKSYENGIVKTEENTQTLTPENSDWLDILGSGQIRKKVLKDGEKDTRPQRSDVCEVNIEGQLADGTLIDKHHRLIIHAGDGEVIQGVDLVLSLMDKGELSLVEISPRFGFGSQGRPSENNFPSVPGDAQLFYTIELVDTHPEPELENISVSERQRIGNFKRERGNWWYGRGENTLAIQCYRRALDYLDEAVGGIQIEPDDVVDDPGKEDHCLSMVDIFEDRIKVYNNLAAAQLKIGALDAALMSVENVLRCQPDNVKALYRKSKILAEKGENQAAVEILERITILDPANSAALAELKVQRAKARENSQQQRNLYRKMLGASATAINTRQKKLETKSDSKVDSGEHEPAGGDAKGSSRCSLQ